MLHVTEHALKNWASGKTGVADLDRVKEIAHVLKIGDYKKLLKKKPDTEKVVPTQEQKTVARYLYTDYVTFIQNFLFTLGFTNFDRSINLDSPAEVQKCLNFMETNIKYARFDLNENVCNKLSELLNEIGYICQEGKQNASFFEKEDYLCFLKSHTEYMDHEDSAKWLYIKELSGTYHNRLCDILGPYMMVEEFSEPEKESEPEIEHEMNEIACEYDDEKEMYDRILEIIDTTCFSDFGLDIEKNFLASPRGFWCNSSDRNGGTIISLETEDDLFSFLSMSVLGSCVERSAVFAKGITGTMHMVVNIHGALQFLKSAHNSPNDFYKLDQDMNFEKYGLVIEVEKGVWIIVEK